MQNEKSFQANCGIFNLFVTVKFLNPKTKYNAETRFYRQKYSYLTITNANMYFII